MRSRGGRWSWTLSPEEIMSREVELGTHTLDCFRFRLFLNSSATDIVLVTLPSTAVETAIAQCISRCAVARGHRLNTSIVLAAVHGLSGLFRAVSAVEPSLSRPLSPLSPSLISHLASVDVKQNGPPPSPPPPPTPISPSLISLVVSVDVKHHVYLLIYRITSEFRSCVKVEVAVLGSQS